MQTPYPEAAAPLPQRIAQAEEQLIARQQRLQRHLADLKFGARQALRPQRLLTPLLGAGLAAVVAGWIWRRWAPLSGAGRTVAPAHPPSGVGGLPWSQLLLIAWPLLPARWRGGLSPATGSAALALAVPLFRRLVGLESGAPLPATVVDVDLARYAGTWFEIARLPAAFAGHRGTLPTITYMPHDDSSEIEVVKRSHAGTDNERVDRGIAHVVPGSGGGQLKVSFYPVWLHWLPLAWDDRWILYLDRGYTVAMVGDPGRRFLSIMARQPQIPAGQFQALVALATDEGYPVQRLHVAAQDAGAAG